MYNDFALVKLISYLFVICEGDATGDREPIQHFTMKDEYGNQLGDGHHIVFVDADYYGPK